MDISLGLYVVRLKSSGFATNSSNKTSKLLPSYVSIRILSVFSKMAKNVPTNKLHHYLNLLTRINISHCSLTDFYSLADYYCKTVSPKVATKQLSAAIAEYVDINYSDSSLNVNALSYVFKKTPSYISALFKSETGKMLNQYISETRIHHSKLLLMTDKKVEDISFECGFSDITTFRRTFKRYVGISPSEFRKAIKPSD